MQMDITLAKHTNSTVVISEFFSVFLCLFAECFPADREQSVEGAAKTAGEPEHLSQQPDGDATTTHHHPARTEFDLTYADGKTTGTVQPFIQTYMLNTFCKARLVRWMMIYTVYEYTIQGCCRFSVVL